MSRGCRHISEAVQLRPPLHPVAVLVAPDAVHREPREREHEKNASASGPEIPRQKKTARSATISSAAP